LTKQVFKNPYTTRYGNTYEHSALVEHITTYGEDYLAKKPLTLDEIFPNTAIQAFIASILKASD